MSPDILDVLTGLVAAFLPFLAYQLNRWVRANVTPRQFAALAGLARTVVDAAEEVGRVNELSGEQKFALAREALVTGSRRLGLKLTDEEVGSFINQAVQDIRWTEPQTLP